MGARTLPCVKPDVDAWCVCKIVTDVLRKALQTICSYNLLKCKYIEIVNFEVYLSNIKIKRKPSSGERKTFYKNTATNFILNLNSSGFSHVLADHILNPLKPFHREIEVSSIGVPSPCCTTTLT